MYAVVVAAMNRQVVAVDADPYNLAYIRRSLENGNNTQNVRILYNSVRLDQNKVGMSYSCKRMVE